MSEINNVNSNGVNQVDVNFSGTTENDSAPSVAPHKVVENLDLSQAAVAGRSQVQPMKKVDLPQVDPQIVKNIKGDLATFKGNERCVALSDKMFDLAIKRGATYDEAVKIQKAFVNDFMKA